MLMIRKDNYHEEEEVQQCDDSWFSKLWQDNSVKTA